MRNLHCKKKHRRNLETLQQIHSHQVIFHARHKLLDTQGCLSDNSQELLPLLLTLIYKISAAGVYLCKRCRNPLDLSLPPDKSLEISWNLWRFAKSPNISPATCSFVTISHSQWMPLILNKLPSSLSLPSQRSHRNSYTFFVVWSSIFILSKYQLALKIYCHARHAPLSIHLKIRKTERRKLSYKLSLANSHATLVLVWPGHKN